MLVLIDADEIVYKSTSHGSVWSRGSSIFRTKKLALESPSGGEVYCQTMSPTFETATKQIDAMVSKIIGRVKDRYFMEELEVVLILSGSGNYRKIAYPSYKANRVSRELPFYLQEAREYAKSKYTFQVAEGMEGDDLMGILSYEQYAKRNECVIASSDKDMLTLPGMNWNIMHEEWTPLSEEEADYNFFTQILVGDVADGVKGAPGIGPVKAAQALQGATNRKERLKRVIAAYKLKGLGEEEVQKAGFLLHIRRAPGYMWSIEDVMNEV